MQRWLVPVPVAVQPNRPDLWLLLHVVHSGSAPIFYRGARALQTLVHGQCTGQPRQYRRSDLELAHNWKRGKTAEQEERSEGDNGAPCASGEVRRQTIYSPLK